LGYPEGTLLVGNYGVAIEEFRLDQLECHQICGSALAAGAESPEAA
jgi:hypothetical protein